MTQTTLELVRNRLTDEVRLLGRLSHHRELAPVGLVVLGYLWLWLAALPLPWNSHVVHELPQEPAFTFCHLLILLAGLCLALGSTLLFLPAWRGRPHPPAVRRFRYHHPLGGIVECWLGLGLLGYLFLLLNGNLSTPGDLMGDRSGRVAFLVLTLLFRGGGLSLAPHLPRRPARILLDLSLVVLLLTLVCFVRYPYVLIDGEFFGPNPGWEAVGYGLLFALAAALGYWYGLRAKVIGLTGDVGDPPVEVSAKEQGDVTGEPTDLPVDDTIGKVRVSDGDGEAADDTADGDVAGDAPGPERDRADDAHGGRLKSA